MNQLGLSQLGLYSPHSRFLEFEAEEEIQALKLQCKNGAQGLPAPTNTKPESQGTLAPAVGQQPGRTLTQRERPQVMTKAFIEAFGLQTLHKPGTQLILCPGSSYLPPSQSLTQTPEKMAGALQSKHEGFLTPLLGMVVRGFDSPQGPCSQHYHQCYAVLL